MAEAVKLQPTIQKNRYILFAVIACIAVLAIALPVYADYFSRQEDSGYPSLSSLGTSDSYLLIGVDDVTSYQSVGESWGYSVTSPTPVYTDYFSGQEDSGYLSLSSSGTLNSHLLIGMADVTSHQAVCY